MAAGQQHRRGVRVLRSTAATSNHSVQVLPRGRCRMGAAALSHHPPCSAAVLPAPSLISCSLLLHPLPPPPWRCSITFLPRPRPRSSGGWPRDADEWKRWLARVAPWVIGAAIVAAAAGTAYKNRQASRVGPAHPP